MHSLSGKGLFKEERYKLKNSIERSSSKDFIQFLLSGHSGIKIKLTNLMTRLLDLGK